LHGTAGVIDQRTDAIRIRDWYLEGVRGFIAEHAQTPVATLAFYSCPWAGWLTLALDTREHSDAHVARWADKDAAKGMAWSGTDDHGRFCDNVPDFAFQGWRALEIEHWKREYEGAAPVIVGLDGRTDRPPAREGEPGYEGDEGYNRPFHRALVALLQTLQHEAAVGDLKRTTPFRMGVQMLDSELSTFWVAEV
jgi:hypothetical protein